MAAKMNFRINDSGNQCAAFEINRLERLGRCVSFADSDDFFFIDGSHSYEYVRSDTLNALKCCHSGSIIAWHDFGLTGVGVHGVTKCVVELSKQYEIYCEPHSRTAFMKVP